MAARDRLRMGTKLAFGVGAGAEAGILIAFNAFNFLFYNNVLGLSGTLCGLAVTIALCFDAISDPLIGSISDRWRSKLGRRHPFLYVAPVPLALCFYAIYTPPEALSGYALFAWFTGFNILLRTFLTFYHVPHLALGAELTDDYRERSVVMSYNAIFGVVGGSSAYFLSWTWFRSLEGGAQVRDGYSALGATIGLLAALVIFISAHFTRDRIPLMSQPPSDLPPFSFKWFLGDMAACLRNRNYQMLLGGLVFLSATSGTREVLTTYLGLFFWELPEGKMRYLAFGSPVGFILAFIFTARMHMRWEKSRTMVAAVTLVIIASITPVTLRLAGLFPENHDPVLLPTLIGFQFLFWGGTAVLAISVMSALGDVADEHELLSGRRQEGIFYSARTFFGKLSSGLGHLLGGIAIDLISFPTGAKPGEVAADVILALGIVDGPIACIPAFAAIYFYKKYSIDKARHVEIASELAARGPASTRATPLQVVGQVEVIAAEE